MASESYDPEAFDSMAVVNSEAWTTGRPDGETLTRDDILPQVRVKASLCESCQAGIRAQGVTGLGKTELEEAFLKSAEHGATDVLRELHALCGEGVLNTVDSDLYTPLHRASYNGHVEAAEYLLSRGARVDAETVDGWQPLHCACRWNKTAVADLLLQNGALVNAQTHGQQTPLHFASSNNRARETLILLLMNPDLRPELVNSQGDTALDVARRCGRYGNLFVMVEESVDYRKFLQPHLSFNKPSS